MFPVQCEGLRINHLLHFLQWQCPMLVDSCDGHIILKTSNDVLISNPGLRYEGLFWEMYILKGQIAFEGHWKLQNWTLLGGYYGRLTVDICDGHLELVAQCQRTQQLRGIATWLCRAKGRFTHDMETMWPLHFKHSHWWKRRSRSKFATSHYVWGTKEGSMWLARWF